MFHLIFKMLNIVSVQCVLNWYPDNPSPIREFWTIYPLSAKFNPPGCDNSQGKQIYGLHRFAQLGIMALA